MAHILLVDDDSDILTLGSAFLTNAGHHVSTVESVVQAVEKLNSERFDLLISDAGMPSLSGFDLILTVKKDPKLQNLPIVMLTGKKEKDDIDKAIGMGVDDYIIKPFMPDVLIQKINDLLIKFPPRKETAAIDDANAPGLQAIGHVTLTIEIQKITESTLTLLSPLYLDEALPLNLESGLLREIGLFDPRMKVLSCTPYVREGRELWKTKLAFSEADERTIKLIRSWMKSNEAA